MDYYKLIFVHTHFNNILAKHINFALFYAISNYNIQQYYILGIVTIVNDYNLGLYALVIKCFYKKNCQSSIAMSYKLHMVCGEQYP